MKRLDVALLVILFVVVSVVFSARPHIPPVQNTHSGIKECKPSESPSPHLCIDPIAAVMKHADLNSRMRTRARAGDEAISGE